MSDQARKVRESYDAVAEAYAEHLSDELEKKPLDRHLLNRFAEELRGKGRVADLGCGPGHVTSYLHQNGVQVFGIDLSAEMIAKAAQLNPGVEFRVGDFTALDLPDASLTGIVAFYSIIHLEPTQLVTLFREFRRVLLPDAFVLLSFHVGEEVIHLDELFGRKVSLDFYFLTPGHVTAALVKAGFKVTESVEREPYEGAEYASRRCYLFARALPGV